MFFWLTLKGIPKARWPGWTAKRCFFAADASHQIIQLDLLLHTNQNGEATTELGYCRLAASHLALQEIPHVISYIHQAFNSNMLYFNFREIQMIQTTLPYFCTSSWYPYLFPKSHSPVSPCQANHTLVAHTSSKNHPPTAFKFSKISFFVQGTHHHPGCLCNNWTPHIQLAYGFWLDLKAFKD